MAWLVNRKIIRSVGGFADAAVSLVEVIFICKDVLKE